LTLFIIFLFLAFYNAGCMTTLQLQHYGIYPAVPREGFAEYVRANNRAATLPTILPALILFAVSVGLVFLRPSFVTSLQADGAFWLNAIAAVSTAVWQRPLQGAMAATGYDDGKVRLLIRTNWIRTISYWLLSALAISILVPVLRTGVGTP
jgi:hypothetical protein